MSHILAIGGGGFQMEDDASPIDDYVVHLTGKPNPRICLLSTPSGDWPEYIDKFYSAFFKRRCEPSHLAFFARDARPGAIPLARCHEQLLTQDAIFVTGGNTRAALAVWREWGIDKLLTQASSEGVLLAGMSAGAMCWFEYALTDSYWEPGYRPLPGLGLLPGACRVHYSDAPEQRSRLHAALAAGAVPSTLAIDDHAAVLFSETAVARVVSWRVGSTAYRLSLNDGHVHEDAYPSESIAPGGD
jgi:dipeptidase E